MTSPSFVSFSDELEKIAARRGLKEIAKAIKGNDVAKASRLAKTPGVLKATAAGSQIKDLGQGGEGVATLVAHPQHGVAVRKLYNPRAVTPELVARKEQAAQLTKNNPNVAKMLGSNKTQQGNTMHMMEYVHGSPVQQTPQNYQAIKNTRQSLAKDLKRGGMTAQDVRAENMVQDASGKAKLIDYLPTKPREYASGQQRTQISKQLQAQGGKALGKNNIVQTDMRAPELLTGAGGGVTAGGIKGNAFRGAPLTAPRPQAVGNMNQTVPSKQLPKTVPGKMPVQAPTNPIPMRPVG